MYYLQSCQDLQLVNFLVVLTKRLVVVVLLEMDSICTNMINAIEYRNDISDGAGLLMGKNSPFKNIPVLGWLL